MNVLWEQGQECWISIPWPNGSYRDWECLVVIEDADGNRLGFADLVDTNARIVWPAVRPEGAARVAIWGQHPEHMGCLRVFLCRATIVP